MIDLRKAKAAFKTYTSHYDVKEDLVRLKIVHTYAVMDLTKKLCDDMKVSQEDEDLAMLIALLHDIGRFEQFVRYGSFVDYQTIDHAQLGSDILFKDGLIRSFVDEDTYDDIIREAIEQHNKFKVKPGYDQRTLFFINMIRDTDKLDNFRVKETEKIETLLGVDYDDLVNETITPKIYDEFMHHQLIYGPDRQTHLDMWLSLAAFIYDFNFKESLAYVRDHDYINRSFDRVSPRKKDVARQYEQMRQEALKYIGQ